MSIKYRLQNYSRINSQVLHLRERIESLEDRMYSIKSSSDISEIPASGGNTDKIAANVALLADLEEAYLDELNKLLEEQVYIETMIKGLEPVERLLIRARYIDGLPWEHICNIIGYSWAQTHRIHSDALEKLGNIAQASK